MTDNAPVAPMTDAELARAMARGDIPVMMTCPVCGAQEEDFDGFGCLSCDACGWCLHDCASGDAEGRLICDLCGKELGDDD